MLFVPAEAASPAQALATLVAAVLGAISASKTRGWTRREQWWTRFTWAIDRATSTSAEESELGLAVLVQLIDSRWTQREDNQMAIAVADIITSRSRRGRRGRRG